MKISIITASYNYAQYIEEAINSVINQTHQDWELIIVDDGSTDRSVEIIKSYCEKDKRIQLHQHENGKNKGLKETLLLGIKHATGDWIAFLESDDIFYPENLSEKIEAIQKYPSLKVVFNKVKFLGGDPNKKHKFFDLTQNKLSKKYLMNAAFPDSMFYNFYLNNQILTFSCAMVESNTLKAANFDTPVDSMLDWWLWIHLAYKNNFYYIDKELTGWNLHTESYISKSKKPIFLPVQVLAYLDIYKQNKSDIKLLLFLICSYPILMVDKFIKFMNKARSILYQ